MKKFMNKATQNSGSIVSQTEKNQINKIKITKYAIIATIICGFVILIPSLVSAKTIIIATKPMLNFIVEILNVSVGLFAGLLAFHLSFRKLGNSK